MPKLIIDLSAQSVNAAIKRLEKMKAELSATVAERFLQLSAEWIKERAIFYLQISHNDMSLMHEIANSFTVTPITRILYKLENTHEKGAYIEFGVGIVGERDAHETAGEVGWKYNIPTDKKTADGEWTFYANVGESVDIREKNRTERVLISGKRARLKVTTKGNEPARFMYQAVLDYMHGAEYQSLYKRALDEVWGR